MKQKITLTKMLTLAILLVTFTTASASFSGEEKCKRECCKEKSSKEVKAAMARLEKTLKQLDAQLKTVSVAVLNTPEVKLALQRATAISNNTMVFAFAAATEESETSTVESKFRINLAELNKEMDKEQEKMTTAPINDQKIDFNHLDKEMNDVQERMSRLDGVQS